MILIWHGLGYLVAVIVFGFSLVANLIFNATHGEGYYDTHKWPFALSLLCSATACWLLGVHLKKRPDQVAIDRKTGSEVAVNRSRHALFFIPMHLWAPILTLLAVLVLVRDLVQ